MSTTDRQAPVDLKPLVDGERLDGVTFHERYAAMPEETRAELIGGRVYMGSPMKRRHGKLGSAANAWLSYDSEFMPGTEVLDNATVLLEDFGEPQPDVCLRILPSHGGRTTDEDGYVMNAPELIVEVADSSLARDLGPKKRDYERAGLPESVVIGIDPPAVRWYRLMEGTLVEVGPDADGFYHSSIFPGLWLDPAAMLAADTRTLRAVVDRGLATEEAEAFRLALASPGGVARG
jgi:Uma2 family endonuclease